MGPDSLTKKDQEDSDQRELPTSDLLSCLERTMMSESTLLEERSLEETRLSIKPHLSKDLLLTRELEERSSTRDQELMPGRKTRKPTSLTKSSSLSTLRKRRPPRKLLSQLQLLRKNQKPKRRNQRRPQLRRMRRNQLSSKGQ